MTLLFIPARHVSGHRGDCGAWIWIHRHACGVNGKDGHERAIPGLVGARGHAPPSSPHAIGSCQSVRSTEDQGGMDGFLMGGCVKYGRRVAT